MVNKYYYYYYYYYYIEDWTGYKYIQSSAKGDVIGQRAMEEEDTGMVSCYRQPSEEEGRLETERLLFYCYKFF